MKDLAILEQKLGITFNNKNLLRQSVVHRSYLNEHPNFPLDHNERLEFLGDAVLELIVTNFLYQNYPNPEGELTSWRAALVNSKSLAEVAYEIELGDFIHLSRGESKDNNIKARESILANAVEALIGAIYLDQGLKQAQKFVEKYILAKLDYVLKYKLYMDPKSRFQEASQEKLGITPTYILLSESGPDHAKNFEIGVFLDKEMVAKGNGSSKQEAQFDAATKALKVKGWQ